MIFTIGSIVSLGISLGLLFYCSKILDKAKDERKQAEKVALDHNFNLVKLKERVEGMAGLLRKPCVNCGHVSYPVPHVTKEKP